MNPFEELRIMMDEADLWQQKFTASRGELLVSKGDRSTDLFWIKSGSVRVYLLDDEREHTIRFGYNGSFITALDSFITGNPTSLWIEILRKAEIWKVDKSTFDKFIQAKPERLTRWLTLVEHLTFQQFERELDLLTSSPAKRFQRVLNRSPRVFQEIPHKYIASYLRMTPETLSRLQKS
ncbi:Crp/Fnr family transcriptional regulator [Halocola ammonii]